MQVILNTQSYNNSINFTSLKRVKGVGALSKRIGKHNSLTIKEKFVTCLNANQSFRTLCDKYNVDVHIIPYESSENALFKKGLSLIILASEKKKSKITDLFKHQEKEIVSTASAEGLKDSFWSLTRKILKNFIKSKDKMEADINKFLADKSKSAI